MRTSPTSGGLSPAAIRPCSRYTRSGLGCKRLVGGAGRSAVYCKYASVTFKQQGKFITEIKTHDQKLSTQTKAEVNPQRIPACCQVVLSALDVDLEL